jgi:hypothetical protein
MADFGGSSLRGRANSVALARIAARLNGLSDKAIDAADKRALVTVRRRTEPTVKMAIREVYNVPARELSGKFRLRNGSDANGQYLELHAATKRVPLIEFAGRWSGRKSEGARATILRGGTKLYKSSFIATVGGQREIVARQFSNDSNSPSGRHPRSHLQRLRGPSPLEMTRGIDGQNARRIGAEMAEFAATERVRQLQLARKGKL